MTMSMYLDMSIYLMVYIYILVHDTPNITPINSNYNPCSQYIQYNSFYCFIRIAI